MAIVDWVESNIDSQIKYTGNGKEIHVCCPICGESRYRMYINLENGKTYCHNCNFSGNMITLIQNVEGVSWTRANKTFQDVKGNMSIPENVQDEIERNVFSSDFRSDLAKRAIPLPDEYNLIKTGSNVNIRVKRAIKYLMSRGITKKQIERHNMGFCSSGIYSNRVIIPITENGELKFWVARAISKDVKLKEKSPSNEEYQISKSEVIFNLDRAAKKYHSIVIAEGIFDALSFSDIGVSLLGKTLYQEQLNILLDYRNLLTEGVYIALDWDARDKATQMAETLSEFFKVKMINIPKNLDDPNNCLQKMGRKYMWKLIDEAEEFGEFSKLKRMLL